MMRRLITREEIIKNIVAERKINNIKAYRELCISGSMLEWVESSY